jgi:PKD repeat protein
VTHGARRRTIRRAARDLATRLGRSQRGQSLTELALILPMLLLLTVIALDFGRIYLGYINVQNMARIAANYAANNPLAWSTSPDTTVQTRYDNQILEDMAATNCRLPMSGSTPLVPDPTFADTNADGTTGGLGDTVTVQISCAFAVATPLISGILGGNVQVTAESNFPVKAGMTAVAPAGTGGGGGGGGSTAPPSAAFVANMSVFSPDPLVVTGPDVVVDFRNASGGGQATSFEWKFGDGDESTDENVAHLYQCAFGICAFVVDFEACNAFGCTTAYMAVIVAGNAEVNFQADRQVIERGQTVTFTDISTPGGTLYEWDFNYTGVLDTPDVSGTDTTVSKTYNVPGTYAVWLRVTYPSPIGVLAPVIKYGYITVNPGYCTVPSLTNVRFNDAAAIWQGSPYNFTGTVKRATGAPAGNFKITAQSIAAGNGATAICTSDVYVSSP